MRRVGSVTRVAQGLAVARSDGAAYPDIGAEVVDESLRAVGRVVDVFGPVDRPYVAITPSGGATAAELLGEKLYAR
jgi:RNA-binding protein